MTPNGAQAVKAPSGMALAEDAPAVQRASNPCDATADNASRAIRLFPTPSAPQMRTPPTSEAVIAASIVRICSERPINGHDKRTVLSLRGRKPPGGRHVDFASTDWTVPDSTMART